MSFAETFSRRRVFLMEGALGERLKREHGLVYDRDVDMAGFVCRDGSRAALESLWREYLAIGEQYTLPMLVLTPTRRANRERISRSAHTDGVIARNVDALRRVRDSSGAEAYLGGTMGCRGDAYTGSGALSESAAERFHAWAAERFALAGADFIYAALMPSAPEAAGLARACSGLGIPHIVSFMLRRDGTLPDGTFLHEAIRRIDESAERPPLCYMVNCVHPLIVADALSRDPNRTETVRDRLRGIQANASPLAPGELEGSAALRGSDPDDLAENIMSLDRHIRLAVAGGGCGTDGRHIEAIARRLASRTAMEDGRTARENTP